MADPSLFRRKDLAALLILASLLLGVYYLSHNQGKVRHTLEFFYLSRGVAPSPASMVARNPLVIEVRFRDTTLVKRLFYSPLGGSMGYSLYLLDADVRGAAKAGGLKIIARNQPARVEQLFVFHDFSVCLDKTRRRAYVFAHSNYLEAAQQVSDGRDFIIGYLLGRTSPPAFQTVRISEEISLPYSEGHYVERTIELPPLSPSRLYEFSFEYRVTGTPRPFLIVGQDPVWFVHSELMADSEHTVYKEAEEKKIVARPPSELRQPVLIMRNWCGVGTAFFRNIQAREVDSINILSPEERLQALGGKPEVIELR